MVSDTLMEEWDEFKRFELFQNQPKPEPKLVQSSDPFRAYTTGPQGQMVADWSAFRQSYTPQQLEIHSTAVDTRDIRDPEQVYNEIVAGRNGTIQGQLEFPDERVFD